MTKSATAPDVCVIGRTNFATGIGCIAYAACELLSRYYTVGLYPVHSGNVQQPTVDLPSGRRIPVLRSPQGARAVFWADVLWNGEHDRNVDAVPEDAFRVAHLAYDSDALPPRWVEILNTRFDAVYFSSHHLIEVARSSGVVIPTGWLPIALDLGALLTSPSVPRGGAVVFGSVASFHQRKGTDVLVRAFVEEFGGNSDARLVLHSNLGFGEFPEHIRQIVRSSATSNIELSMRPLERAQVVSLMKSFDVAVSCSMGEGYSIGPREAMALGKSLVLSDLGPHEDLQGVDGVFTIPTTLPRPARYPELDGRIFGMQSAVALPDARAALRAAFDYARSGAGGAPAVRRRRNRAAEFTLERLGDTYARVLVPDLVRRRPLSKPSSFAVFPPAAAQTAAARVGRVGSHLTARDRVVVPAHDAPVLSVLNRFVEHLVSAAGRDHQPLALPDWDTQRVFGPEYTKVRYFRYADPEPRNLWNTIFEPFGGVNARQLENRHFLYDRASVSTPEEPHGWFPFTEAATANFLGEPDVARTRRLFGKHWAQHVKLLPGRRAELAAVEAGLGEGFRVAVALGSSGLAVRDAALAEASAAVADELEQWLATRRRRIATPQVLVLCDDGRPAVLDALRGRGWRVETLPGSPTGEGMPASVEPAGHGDWLELAADRPHSSADAWTGVLNAMVLANCQVALARPGDTAQALAYMNPTLPMIALT